MLEQALHTAGLLIKDRFPNCMTAILAGSIVRGEGTNHSDLDIFIIDSTIKNPYRESMIYLGWPVEMFVHTLQSYKEFFQKNCERARPSLPQMVVEGKIIIENDLTKSIVQEAAAILKKGPSEWTAEQRNQEQYALSDLLDDFEGSSSHYEDIFIAGSLANKAHEFYLRMNGQWIGSSKWVFRALKRYNPIFAERFAGAFSNFNKTGDKTLVVNLVDDILKPYGGRLFDGFSLGKN